MFNWSSSPSTQCAVQQSCCGKRRQRFALVRDSVICRWKQTASESSAASFETRTGPGPGLIELERDAPSLGRSPVALHLSLGSRNAQG